MHSRLSVLVLSIVVLALLAAPSAQGAAPTGNALFVQAAEGGSFRDGRLTLRGVSRQLVWFSDRPERESGTVSFARFRQGLFSGDQPRPNAALDIAGAGLAGIAAVKLSSPRFNAARGVVSYRVQRLKKVGGNLDGYSDEVSRRPLPRNFGPASLFIDNAFGNTCHTTINNATGYPLQTIAASKWSSDEWKPELPVSFGIAAGDNWNWGSQGGAFRGCSNSAVWELYGGASGTFSLETTDPWEGENTITCVSSNPAFRCTKLSLDDGVVSWSLGPA